MSLVYGIKLAADSPILPLFACFFQFFNAFRKRLDLFVPGLNCRCSEFTHFVECFSKLNHLLFNLFVS